MSRGAWLSVGGWPVFTRNALAGVDPSKTKVISFDTVESAVDLLREFMAEDLGTRSRLGKAATKIPRGTSRR